MSWRHAWLASALLVPTLAIAADDLFGPGDLKRIADVAEPALSPATVRTWEVTRGS